MAESGFEPTGVRLQSLALSWPPVRAGFGFDGFYPLEGLSLFGTFLVLGVGLFVFEQLYGPTVQACPQV